MTQFVLLGVIFLSVLGPGLATHHPNGWLALVNGFPEAGAVMGTTITRVTALEARIAVVAAGTVPYFSRRYSIDMLGKSDAHIAHLALHPVDYSLSLKPDLVVTLWPRAWAATLNPQAADPNKYHEAIVGNAGFRAEFLPNPVPLDAEFNRMPVYIARTSPELARLNGWQMLRITP